MYRGVSAFRWYGDLTVWMVVGQKILAFKVAAPFGGGRDRGRVERRERDFLLFSVF